MDLLRGCAAFAFIVLNTVFWFVPIAVLGVVRRLLPPSSAPLRDMRTRCGRALAGALQGWVICAKAMAQALRIAPLDLRVQDAERRLKPDGWYLLIANHQSWADILVLVFAFHGIAPAFVFLTKRELIWVPLIGVALWLLEFPYVRRYSPRQLRDNPALRGHDRDAVRKACAGIRERPTCVLNFVEGTRFTLAKRDAQQSPYRTLLKPRTGGLRIAAEALADRVTAVVDVTIAYAGPESAAPAGQAPDFWSYLCGRCRRVDVQARVLPPPSGLGDDLRPWLEALWKEKDAALTARRAATGQRPA